MGADLLKAWERDTKYDVSLVLRHSTKKHWPRSLRSKGGDIPAVINVHFWI
jgi:hypothetical protein